MELGARLELDPADPPLLEEDRWQPEMGPSLLDHLAGGADVGVEADTEVGELRLEGGRGDHPGVPPTDQAASGIPGGVVGAGLRPHRVEGPAPEDRPHAAAQQSEDDGQHGQDDQGHQGGHQDLVHRVGLVGVADGPGRETRAQMAEDPGGHGHPQEGGHAEGDQQPPCVAPDPPVQGAGDHEPGQARRVAQAVEPGQPRGVVGRLGVERTPSRVRRPSGRRRRAWRRPPDRTRLGAAAPGSVGVLPGLDPHHPDPGGGLEVEVDRAERVRSPGRR